MWDWRQLRWLNYFGWWPNASKTKKSQLISRYYGILLFVFNILASMLIYVKQFIYMREGNLQAIIVNLSSSLVAALCLLKITVLLVKYERILLLPNLLQELDSSPLIQLLGGESKTIRMKGDFRCGNSLWFLPISLIALLHWLLRPVILLSAHNHKTYIVDMWIPWTNQSLAAWITIYLIQIVQVTSLVTSLLFFDSLFICIAETIIAEFSLLSLALNKIDFKKIYRISYKKDGNKQEMKMLTIEVCIDFHRKLLRAVKILTNITDIQQIAQIGVLIFSLCFSVYEISSVSGVTVTKMLNLIELIVCFQFLNVMYSYYSTEISQQGLDIGRAAYMNNWYQGNKKEKKCLIMLVERCKRKQVFGLFMDINLNSVITVLKTAFSYYSVLKTLNINS